MSRAPEANVVRLVEALRGLDRDLAVASPQNCAIAEEEWRRLIPLMVRQAIASGSPANNPRVPSSEEMSQLYEHHWSRSS